MPVKESDILRAILLKEEETETLPQGFEDDPMGFILKKYPGLNNVMEYMMTESFKEYVDAIFVVAPKPTTFKILLHNGQYFFLQFMGKAYQATVLGKNYYLMSVGEKERCMLAIARLLRYGSPLKTKGPEGAEQGTAGGETGGEGGEAGGGEATGGEAAAPEAGGEAGGEETPVTEAKVLQEILKNFLLEQVEDTKDSQEKKTTETSNVKKNDPDAYKLVVKTLEKSGKRVSRETKNGGLHARIMMTKADFEDFIKKEFSQQDCSISEAYPGDKDSRSGTYSTYVIKFNRDIQGANSGDEVLVVPTSAKSKTGGETTVGSKELTPKDLGLDGNTFSNADSLASSVEGTIDSKYPKHSDMLKSLVEDVRKGTKQTKSLSEVKDATETINMSEETKEKMTAFSIADINIMGKNFGEVLGAIFLGKYTGGKDIYFPDASNQALIDFTIDGYKISSKYKKGAAASMTELISGLGKSELSEEEQELYDKLKVFEKKDKPEKAGGPNAFITLAKSLQLPGIQALTKALGIEENELTAENINSKIIDMISGVSDPEQKSKIVLEKLNPFYDAIDHRPSKNIQWSNMKSSQLYGLVTSPLSYCVADELNKNQSYVKTLKSMVSKTEIKQMYLDFKIGKKQIVFDIKSFNSDSATFKFDIPSISVTHPTASKLGFRMNS